MTERELIKELATLGKIYLDCHEAKMQNLHTPPIHNALELAELYAYNKLRQFARNYAMEADKNGAGGTAQERRNLQGEFGKQNPDHNAAQWKLAILRQMKEVNHDA